MHCLFSKPQSCLVNFILVRSKNYLSSSFVLLKFFAVEAVANLPILRTKCPLCGCHTMNAVAGGQGGCGCVIGCYDKALLLLEEGGSCPKCDKKLIEIVKVFIEGVPC